MNYATDISIYGMLPANAEFVPGTNRAVYKNKQHKQILSWDKNFTDKKVPVSYFYIDSKPSDCRCSKMTQLIVGKFDEAYFKMSGNKNKRFRRIIHKYDKHGLKISKSCPREAVLNLIARWEEEHGKKTYRMQMHSSYDKRFFKKSLDTLQDKVTVYYCMDGERCVGYKVIETSPYIRDHGLLEYIAMLKKYDTSYSRICEYLDYAVYREMFNDNGRQPFVINSGCSSGKVAQYKREKFPVYETKDLYFYKRG